MDSRYQPPLYCLIGCSLCNCQQPKERQKRMLLCENVWALHHHWCWKTQAVYSSHTHVHTCISGTKIQVNWLKLGWLCCFWVLFQRPWWLTTTSLFFFSTWFLLWPSEKGKRTVCRESECMNFYCLVRNQKRSGPTMWCNSVEQGEATRAHLSSNSHNRVSFCCLSSHLLCPPQANVSGSNFSRAAHYRAGSLSTVLEWVLLWHPEVSFIDLFMFSLHGIS